MSGTTSPTRSVWHEGELQVQQRAGVRAEADQLSGMYKREIPAAMAGFLAQQPFAILSTVDHRSRVWAHLLAGPPGILAIRSANSIALLSSLIETDVPFPDLEADPQVGLLAIDFSRRIRVRVNGKARIEPDDSVAIDIDQLYGNCSQYIQKRIVTAPSSDVTNHIVSTGAELSASQQQLIAQADTFFIASRHPELGADASHRGGKSGFIHVASPRRVSFPDYAGNNMFNTLGNLAINPKLGLLFFDFESGRTLQLTGRATVDWNPVRAETDKAHRVIDVEIDEVRDTGHATSLRYRFIGYSPTLG